MVFYLYGPGRKNLGSSANFGPASDGGGGCGSGAARRKIAFPFSEAWVSPGGSHFSPGTSPAHTGAAAPLFLSLLET